jgi:hypothetical protein
LQFVGLSCPTFEERHIAPRWQIGAIRIPIPVLMVDSRWNSVRFQVLAMGLRLEKT